MNAVCKYAWHKWFSNREKWYPIAAVYYLTYRCAFRCGYCSDGNGTPYYALADEEVAGEHAFAVIQKIRKYADCLILTGGEPLSFPDLEYVLERLPELAFKEVVFTTNGHHLQHHLDSVAQAVTHLIVSVDTVNPVKADELTGMPTGTFKTVLGNLEGAKNKAKKRYTIYISSVATPDNLEDLREVYEFAQKNGYTFAVQPQLVGVKGHPALFNNEAYMDFYDFLIEQKLQGNRIYGTVPYLRYMRNLKQFLCSPFTMLVVTPQGEVFYPCLEIGNKAGNILEYNSLHEIRQRGRELFGPQPVCDNRCQSACALGFSMLLQHPFSFIEDAFLTAKGTIKRKIGISI